MRRRGEAAAAVGAQHQEEANAITRRQHPHRSMMTLIAEEFPLHGMFWRLTHPTLARIKSTAVQAPALSTTAPHAPQSTRSAFTKISQTARCSTRPNRHTAKSHRRTGVVHVSDATLTEYTQLTEGTQRVHKHTRPPAVTRSSGQAARRQRLAHTTSLHTHVPRRHIRARK